jgi:T5orf172 domain/Domain of unknown function (DUF5655)
MPGYLKIGMTSRTPEERAREISQGTGVAAAYNVAYSENVINCEAAERLIHSRLDKFRVNRGREFFHLPLQDAIRELSEIAGNVGRCVTHSAEATPSPDHAAIFSGPELDQVDGIQRLKSSERTQNVGSIEAAPTEDELINRLPSELGRVYLELRTRAMTFGPHVETYATRRNLVFKAKTIFAEFQQRRASLRVLIQLDGFNIPENGSADVHGINVTRVPDTHLWRINHKFEINGESSLENVAKLLKLSYDAVCAEA